MTSAKDYPMGGKLSDDLQLPDCPACDRNNTGLFTERSATQVGDYHCVKCGVTFIENGTIIGDAPVETVPEANPVGGIL